LQAEEKAREEKKPHYKEGDEIFIELPEQIKRTLATVDPEGTQSFVCGAFVMHAIAEKYGVYTPGFDFDHDLVTGKHSNEITNRLKCRQKKSLLQLKLPSFLLV